MTDDRRSGALTPDFQLIDGCCTERIGSSEHNAFALLLVVSTELANRCRLAHAVDADDQHDRWSLRSNARFIRARSQQLSNLLLQEGLQILRCIDLLFLDALAYTRHELFRSLHADIGHDECFFQLIKEIIVDIRIAKYQLFNFSREGFPCFREPFFQFIKKSHNTSSNLFYLIKPHRNDLRYACVFNGYAIHEIRCFHRAFTMCYNDELRIFRKLLQETAET